MATETEVAIQNLQAIKAGEDPRQTNDGSGEPDTDDPLVMARDEVDRLFEEHGGLSALLPRERVHVAVARWDRKNGHARYDHRPSKDRLGKRASYTSHLDHHSVIVNERMVESGEPEKFIDTVRHEVAHVAAYEDPDAGPGRKRTARHGYDWKQWARLLGAEPSSCKETNKSANYNYFLGCENGCYVDGRVRKSKIIKHPGRYHCGTCGGSILTWPAGGDRPDAIDPSEVPD